MDHPYQQYPMSPMTPTTPFSASSSQRDLIEEPKIQRVMERKPVLYTTGTGFTETEPPIYSTQPGSKLTNSISCADSQKVSPTSTITWWWIEILSALGALVCMLALVILLRLYENKPQPNWDMISLNTVVVAISTTSRTLFMIPVGAALSQGAWIWFSPEKQQGKIHSKLSDLEVFDEASRGPWGSLKLLFRMKFMFHLASIGSLITLLTLGFDIFTQQLLASQVRMMDSDRFTAGTVPRAEHYNKWQHGAISGIKDVVFEAKASIYSGILTENINPLAVTCSSGNCTWPTIPTLGVCGSCTKTTFNKSCETIYLGSTTNFYEQCNFTLPSGTVIEGIKDSFSFQDAFSVVPVIQSNTSIYNYADETMPYLSIFDMIGTYYQGNDFNANTAATECALWLCLQAYDITVNNTDQIQKTTQTYSTVMPVESPIYNYTANRTFTNIPASFNVDPAINYTMEGYAFYAFQNTLWKIFSGNVTSGMGSATWDYTNDFIQGIWNGTSGTYNTTGDPDAWIQKLALSMTNSIRSLGSSTEDTGRYAGAAQSPQNFVSVRWNWIILPAALVAATLVYLALIVMETRNGGARGAAWKGSPLSMLIADVDPGVRERARGWEMRKDGVENMVGGIEARLVRGPYGWRFEGQRGGA